MIASDTSSLSAFFQGHQGSDVDRVASALQSGALCLPPVVLTELLSDPRPDAAFGEIISAFQRLDILDGYWARAGEIRRLLKLAGHKAKIADALIAQSCLDHDVALITRDTDFRHFENLCGLKLA